MSQKSIQELFDLSGKTAIVTGGAKGIGFGIVQRLLEAGANVVIADMADDVGENKAKAAGKKCAYVHADVSSEKDVKSMVEKTVSKFGRLDIMVNNAGIFPSVPVLDMKLDLWEKVQAVNLRGVFLCSREAGKVMAKQNEGVMVNIASIDALHPSQVGLASYDASKHGVWGFTKNFALEMADKHVRVNAIAPGGVITEGVEEMTQGAIRAGSTEGQVSPEFSAHIPMKRMGVPDDIAMATLFLASDASSYMTGTITVVDGGYLLA
jgi:2-deoxy-D-gluconate 3-dehydrogenase